MNARSLLLAAGVGSAGFVLGIALGPALLDPTRLGDAPSTPDLANPAALSPPGDSAAGSKPPAPRPIAAPDPSLGTAPARSAESPSSLPTEAAPDLTVLREKIRAQAAQIHRLQNQVARTDLGIVATQIARRAGLDVDELEMMLDDRRLIGSLELLAKTAKQTTIDNLWNALQLEAEYLEHIEHLEHNGPPVGAVASDAARQRFHDYRRRVIHPWIDNNLETLCTRLRNLGIPQLLIDNFRRRCQADR